MLNSEPRTVHKLGSFSRTDCGLAWEPMRDYQADVGGPGSAGIIPGKRDLVKILGALTTCPECITKLAEHGIPLDRFQRTTLKAHQEATP